MRVIVEREAKGVWSVVLFPPRRNVGMRLAVAPKRKALVIGRKLAGNYSCGLYKVGRDGIPRGLPVN